MACNGPLVGWYSRKRNPSGLRSVVFRFKDGFSDRPVTMPCGKCLGCRLAHARDWGIRCYHEASMFDENVFVTLTYKEDELPRTHEGLPTLRPRDFVLFMKAVRRARGPGVRFFHCGEYGALGRPHHHVLLFNCGFSDGVFFKKSSSGDSIFTSAGLSRLWNRGFSSFGNVAFASAAYVAQYHLKKIGGSEAPGRVAEYLTMSRRPGIGAGWYEKYKSGVFPRDEVVVGLGSVYQAPRFYVERLRKQSVLGYEQLKAKRAAREVDDRGDASRYYVKEKCLSAKLQQSSRRVI